MIPAGLALTWSHACGVLTPGVADTRAGVVVRAAPQRRRPRWIPRSRLPSAVQYRTPVRRPLMLDMRVIFMDVAVGRWGLPSVEMETLLWRSPNRV